MDIEVYHTWTLRSTIHGHCGLTYMDIEVYDI